MELYRFNVTLILYSAYKKTVHCIFSNIINSLKEEIMFLKVHMEVLSNSD